ncbi:MAG TPA: glycosyl hydrolase, partial [Patescibacteria group bacterium]|nr:glycosyl hydrolase [Patescibacteria group bacterium]
CIRGNVTYGDGVYKSVDGGRSWASVGLRDTRQIGAVVIDPKNPDIVFVAALGHAFGPSSERGVFRSTNGGVSWDKVLFKDDRTGAIDVVFDPANPSTLYASLWQVVRSPYSLSSGGPGSGLYKSVDGGVTWKRLEGNGLPEGILGRIGVSVSGGDSSRVYALIEAEQGGLYRSDDAGLSWSRVNDDGRFRQRAWYFTHVFADTKNPDAVYVLNTGLFRSMDGGRSFSLLPAPHGDHHGFWIDPDNPDRLINGNDGGATISIDGGRTWTTQENQPTAQFYHVITDNEFPYNVYGAQQDNTSVVIASASDDGVIGREDWSASAGGESGYLAPDPRDANIVYGGTEGGDVTRLDRRSHTQQAVSPVPIDRSGHGAEDFEHRFQWTMPVLLSPHDPDVLYVAGEVVFRSSDHGATWSVISPDLTRNDKSRQKPSGGPITKDITSVEYYDTIFALAESPRQKGVIWAGSDDGLIHVTRDGGAKWTNVTPKDLPEWSMISIIDPSPHDAASAVVAVDRHKLDDLRPWIYRTADYGRNWTKIVTGIPDGAYVRSVREDPARKGLLFAGTEKGVFVSFNDGDAWQPLQLNLPLSPVHDLAIKGDDLIAATHGRSFWILDDITPLRQVDPAAGDTATILYKPADTWRLHYPGDIDKSRPGGQNPPAGAIIDYYFKTRPTGEVTLEILDGKGGLVRRFSSKEQEKSEQPPEWPDQVRRETRLPIAAGMNRFVWDLRHEEPLQTPGAFYVGNPPSGPLALPGVYQARLTTGGKSLTASFAIKPDPRVKATAMDLEKQFDLASRVTARITQLHKAINDMRDLRAQMLVLKKRASASPGAADLLTRADDLEKKIAPIEQDLIQVKLSSSEGTLAFPTMLNEQFYNLSLLVDSAGDGAPARPLFDSFDQLSRRLDAALARWSALAGSDVPALDQAARRAGLAWVSVGGK